MACFFAGPQPGLDRGTGGDGGARGGRPPVGQSGRSNSHSVFSSSGPTLQRGTLGFNATSTGRTAEGHYLSFKRILAEKLGDSLHGPLELGTPRTLPTTLVFPQKATAVIGMRRAGKTTLLHQIRQHWIDQGHVREQVPFVNFEDERSTNTGMTSKAKS